MNSPIYSYTSNPHAVSRMGTVHYSRNNGNHSAVPMMPMYGGPVLARIGETASSWWQEKGKEMAKRKAQEHAEKVANEKMDQFLANQSGPTPVSTPSGSGSSTGETALERSCRIALTKNPNDPFCVSEGFYIDPVTGLGVKGRGQQLSSTKPSTTPKMPKGPLPQRQTSRPMVAEDTFLEKISKNRFNIVLASSALLLGVILINRRRQQ